MQNKFTGGVWKDVAQVLDMKDANGQQIKDIGAYLEDALRRAFTGQLDKNSAEFQNIVETFGKLSTDWAFDEKYARFSKLLPINAVKSTFESVVDNFQRAARAVEVSDLQDLINDMKESRISDSYQILNKIEQEVNLDELAK